MNKECLISVRDGEYFQSNMRRKKFSAHLILAGYTLIKLTVRQLFYVLSALWENRMRFVILWKIQIIHRECLIYVRDDVEFPKSHKKKSPD